MEYVASMVLFVAGHALLYRRLNAAPKPAGITLPRVLAGTAQVSARWLAGVVAGIGLLSQLPILVAFALTRFDIAAWQAVVAIAFVLCLVPVPLLFWLPVRSAWLRVLDERSEASAA